MITCDYLIIGSGFAGLALKYKLAGKTILLDKKPFSYKIGESHVPNLANSDPGVFSLIPKITQMKSYTRKLGTVFCDSYHGKYASNFSTPLGVSFAFHCEREEIEKLFSKELSAEIRQETILDIDLSKNIVKTNKNTYRFTKYILDCSGPAMVIANKLDLVTPVDQFRNMKAQWSYWAIDGINSGLDSWANWTVINKIASDSWMWQIPLYNSSILSMGLLHRGEPLSDKALIAYCKEYKAACYQLTSIVQNPRRAIKPYMKEVHSRFHYSKRSLKSSGDNWILVGDAFCFADPVYSTGSGVAMLEAITIANILNKNGGQFDHAWYDKHCNALIKTVIDGIGTWYAGTAFDKKINRKINRTILQGGFSRHFQPSKITDRAKRLQLDNLRAFSTSIDKRSADSLESMKVYDFNKSGKGKLARMSNKVVRQFFEKHVLGKRLSYSDLYLLVELHLPAPEDKNYFWKYVRLIELTGSKNKDADRLFYFHPEKCRFINGHLKLGGQGHYLTVKEPDSVKFFEKLTGKLFFGKELIKLSIKGDHASPRTRQDLRIFLKRFYPLNTFGHAFYV